MDLPTTTVHIESPSEVDLEYQANDAAEWQAVCISPCDKPMPTSGLYRINGATIRLSGAFRLTGAPRTEVRVDPSSALVHGGGVFVMVVGIGGLVPAAAVTVGTVTVFVFGAILVCPLVQAFTKDKGAYGQCLVDGAGVVAQYYAKPYVWVPALGGLALLLGGGTMYAATPSTKATVDGPPAKAPSEAPASPQITGAARRPEWRDGVRDPLSPPPLPPTAPIVNVTF